MMPDKKWQWQEGEYTVTRTTQWSGPGCHEGCGVMFYTKDNKLVKVEGDLESPHYNGRLCMRCLDLHEAVNHPDRLKYPMRRVGNRGENKWERISWDEAYDIIGDKVRQIQKDYGAESIVGMMGTGRNIWSMMPFLVHSGFQSPNTACGFLSGDACYLPRAALQGVMTGDFLIVDCSQMFEERYNSPQWKRPECIMIWGNNPIISNPDGFMGHWIVDCMKMGTKIIVVDPRLTWLASRAEHWLQIRPGTDTALAMGMLNVIINEELYDKEFVDKWTYGFEDLKQRVQEYPPEKVAEITWVPKDKIIEAARFYAKSKPAAIQWGLAIDTQRNGISAAHAVSCLWTITGNVDIPGGNIIVRRAYDAAIGHPQSDLGWLDLPEEVRAKRLGVDKYPLYKFGFCATAHSDTVLETIESGKPYPIKMLWLQTTNTFVNMSAEAKRVYEAMKKVDFIVSVDLFMTPTAMACADIVLPAAMSCERNSLRSWWTPMRSIVKVIQTGEAKSDEEIVLELGKRLNPKAFPWNNVEEMLDWALMEAGQADFSFKDLKEKVYSYPAFEYKKYEKGLLRPDGEPGFNTSTGKIELFVTLFKDWGYDPLPYFEEPPESPYSTPQLFKEYPLILSSGGRSWEFFHSEHRQLPTMRESHPDPLVEIHPDTAEELGIKDGDWVWIENRHGKCKQKAKVTPGILPKVVQAEHGWWFPEKPAEEPNLFGVWESNINLLTTQCETGPAGYGAPYKNQICKIYKAE